MFAWLRVFLPQRHKDDPAAADAAKEIAFETTQLAQATKMLSRNIESMRREHTIMRKALDDVVNLIQERDK